MRKASQFTSRFIFLFFFFGPLQTVRPLVYDAIRKEVDEEMKVVLQNLKDMLIAERAGKGGKKGAKGKKGKKGKKVVDSTNKMYHNNCSKWQETRRCDPHTRTHTHIYIYILALSSG